MNIGFVRIVIATALIACAIEKLFVFQTRRTTIMKKKLLVLGALLALGANVNFVEASGSSTYTTAVEFKDESTSSSEFTNLTHLDNWPHFDKRGVTKIDGSVIQLHSTEPRQIDEPNQLTTLTGKELRFEESGQFLATYTMHGMDVSDHRKGITAVGGSITLYGYPTDYEYDGEYDDNYYSTHPERDMEFSIDNVDVGGQQIHGVHVGEADTDAVNVSQLKEVESKISNIGQTAISAANHYTDLQVAKVGASANALGGLKFLDYNPNDKWSFATSVGHYKNASAVAIGASYQPNENVMIHVGSALDGNSSFNIGASFKVGSQDPQLKMNKWEMARQIKDLQADNADLRAELKEIKMALQRLQ